MDPENETVGTTEEKKPTDEERYARLIEVDPNLSVSMIKSLKAKYDRVLATQMNNKVYMYRPITRLEYTKLMAGLEFGQSSTIQQREQMVEEKIVEKCILYPTNLASESFTNTKGGTVTALKEAILFCSDFFTTEQVLAMTEEL